jgi:hypothetical protein
VSEINQDLMPPKRDFNRLRVLWGLMGARMSLNEKFVTRLRDVTGKIVKCGVFILQSYKRTQNNFTGIEAEQQILKKLCE